MRKGTPSDLNRLNVSATRGTSSGAVSRSLTSRIGPLGRPARTSEACPTARPDEIWVPPEKLPDHGFGVGSAPGFGVVSGAKDGSSGGSPEEGDPGGSSSYAMSENATSPMRAFESINCWRTIVIVRFASGLMLRETSSTTMPPTPPGTSPRPASARLRPVSTAATTRPISTTARTRRITSVRRTAGARSAVVAIGTAGPRTSRRRLRTASSVPIGPLFDHAPDVERQRLGQRRQRRRLGPRKLLGGHRELRLAGSRELVRQELERLAPLRRLGGRALDEHECALQRTADPEAELPGHDEPREREQR